MTREQHAPADTEVRLRFDDLHEFGLFCRDPST